MTITRIRNGVGGVSTYVNGIPLSKLCMVVGCELEAMYPIRIERYFYHVCSDHYHKITSGTPVKVNHSMCKDARRQDAGLLEL